MATAKGKTAASGLDVDLSDVQPHGGRLRATDCTAARRRRTDAVSADGEGEGEAHSSCWHGAGIRARPSIRPCSIGDVCRRYVRLKLHGLQDVDYRTKTFSCSKCGAAAYVAVIEPTKETRMADYRLDEIEAPEHHPKAVQRLTGREQRSSADQSGGELPGRNLKGRR